MAKPFLSVKIEGVKLFVNALKKEARELSRKNVQFLNSKAIHIQRDAKIDAPVITGQMRSGLSMDPASMLDAKPQAMVRGLAFYTPYVDLGTGQRGRETYKGKLPEGYEHGNIPGQRAQMFLTNAVNKTRKTFRDDYAKAMK